MSLPPLRQTRTVAVLEVTAPVYAEIRAKLVAAGYDHALMREGDGEAIDMHGIALQAGPADPVPPAGGDAP